MPQDTGIDYCDSTANIMMGCDGCELWSTKIKTCYAGVLTNRHAGKSGWPVSFDQPKVFSDRINVVTKWKDLFGKRREGKPWLDGWPRIVFLNDMGDTFTEGLPVNWLTTFMEALESSPHIYLLLTKRPQRAKEFFDYWGYVPNNFWVGTTITSMANIGRVSWLASIPACVRFLSVEPLLGEIDLIESGIVLDGVHPAVDWIILGGESGPVRRAMNPAWVHSIKDQCQEFEIPFFFKQWGGLTPKGAGNEIDGKKYLEMPKKYFDCL